MAVLWFELPCAPARPVPVAALRALDDPKLPYAGGRIEGVPPGVPEQIAVEDTIATWAERDGWSPSPDISDTGGGGAILTWLDCTAPFVLHRLPSGGHDWPPLASTRIAEMAAGS